MKDIKKANHIRASLLVLCLLFSACAFSQNWQWARSAQGLGINSFMEVSSVANDRSGNAFVAGTYSDSIRIGPYTLLPTGTGGPCPFIAKYDGNGQLLWVSNPTIVGNNDTMGITIGNYFCYVATDTEGNAYLTGSFVCSKMQFGAYPLLNNNYAQGGDIFLAKYSPGGNVIWATGIGGDDDDVANSVAVDREGNAFVAGSFVSDSIRAGNTMLYNGSNPGQGFSDVLLIKFGPGGNVLWANSGSGPTIDQGSSVATDAAGNAYFTGNFYSTTLTFGSKTLHYIGGDVFLVKYDPAGNVAWTYNTNADLSACVATDRTGNVFITGSFFSDTVAFGTHKIANASPGNYSFDLFLAKFDTDGNPQWALKEGGAGEESGYAVTTDRAGNIYVSGQATTNPITLGITSFANPPVHTGGNLDNSCLVKYDQQGNVLCATVIGAAGDDVSSLSTDASGNVYFTGDAVQSPFLFGNDTIRGGLAREYMFLVKWNCGCSIAAGILGDTATCKGDSVTLTATGGTGYVWNTGNVTGQIKVSPAATAGYSVVASDGLCVDTSDIFTLAIKPLPNQPVLDPSDTLICPSDSAIIVALGAYRSYLWNTGDTVDHTYATQAGGYWVSVTGSNGCHTVSAHLQINVYPVPSVSIIVNGDTLSSMNAVSYQWYLNDTLITGAINSVYVAKESGDYTIHVVDSNGCDASSNKTHVTITGIREPGDVHLLDVYPNPFSNQLFIKADKAITEIGLFDITGREIIMQKINEWRNTPFNLEVQQLEEGFYYLRANGLNGVTQTIKLMCINGLQGQ